MYRAIILVILADMRQRTIIYSKVTGITMFINTPLAHINLMKGGGIVGISV